MLNPVTAPMSDATWAPVLVFITPLSATKNLSVSEPAADILPKEIAILIESSVGETVALIPEPLFNLKV